MLVLIVLSYNAINIIKGTQTTEPRPIEDWREDGIILMQNQKTGEYACFGCSDRLCIDPAPVMQPVEETQERYCNSNFKLVENNNIIQNP